MKALLALCFIALCASAVSARRSEGFDEARFAELLGSGSSSSEESSSSGSSSRSGSSSGSSSRSGSSSGSSSGTSSSSGSSSSGSSGSSSRSGSSSSGSSSSGSGSSSDFAPPPVPPHSQTSKSSSSSRSESSEESSADNFKEELVKNMHMVAVDDDGNKDQELAEALQTVKDQIVAKANEIKAEKKWVREVTKIIEAYVKKTRRVNGNIRQLQKDVKMLFRKKKQIENMIVQRKLEKRLKVAVADMTTINLALKNVKVKETAFNKSKNSIKATISAMETALKQLRGTHKKKGSGSSSSGSGSGSSSSESSEESSSGSSSN